MGLTPGEQWVQTGWVGGPQSCREWNPPCVATGKHAEHVPAGHPEWRQTAALSGGSGPNPTEATAHSDHYPQVES